MGVNPGFWILDLHPLGVNAGFKIPSLHPLGVNPGFGWFLEVNPGLWAFFLHALTSVNLTKQKMIMVIPTKSISDYCVYFAHDGWNRVSMNDAFNTAFVHVEYEWFIWRQKRKLTILLKCINLVSTTILIPIHIHLSLTSQ